MQTVSTELLNTLEQDVGLEIYSQVVSEWELNAYYETSVSGSPSTNEELFPTESIALPRRPPRRGLPKLIVNYSRITGEGTFPKFRIPSTESNYKYYHSERKSNGSGVLSTPVELTVEYDEPAPCNKIVVGFETSAVSPGSTEVLVTYNGTDWVSTGYHNIDSEGLITLWLQSNGTWGTLETLYEDNNVGVRGWRVRVEETAGANQGVSVIQVSPRLAMDLTNRVIDVSVRRQRENFDITNPIGTAASSTADLQFANDDRLFDQENPQSVLKNLIDRNVRFDVSDVVVRSDGLSEAVPQGVFFADDWSVGSDGTASVNASDRSKFTQETIVENSFYWSRPAEFIVTDILDRFGHPNYTVRYTAADLERRIPYVFFKDDQTVWDALQSLALAEQASFYFDEQDRFVWESRDYVWESTTPDWTLRNDIDGVNLPNLIDWNPQFEIGANKVNVKYTKLSPASSAGQVINNVVWEESEETVLNSSSMRSLFLSTYDAIRIDPDDWGFWPEEGIFNVDGEYARYKKDSETKGRLIVTERGLFGSEVKDHKRNTLENNGRFRGARRLGGSSYQKIMSNSRYAKHRIYDSYVEIETPGNQSFWNTGHFFLGELGNSYAWYGTEVVFPVSFRGMGEPYYDGEGVAGLFLHHDGDWNGYYFELVTTQFSTQDDHRKAEVRAWRRSDGVHRFIGSEPGGGSQDIFPEVGRLYDIVPGRRYRLDVLYRRISGENQFEVFVEGVSVLSFTDSAPGTKRTNGYWGVFSRAKTTARFESVWAISSPLDDDDILTIQESLRDRTNGGFNSGLLENVWKKANRPYADVRFEDFGPIVHGGLEFDVDYEISPNTATELFVSNDEEHFVVFHERDPFKSKFAIVNKSRGDSVLVGSDPSRDNENMSLFVYGRPIVEEDESSITREDALARRRRGLEELEVSSPWIQTKPRAERIADWLVERWGKSNDVVEAQMILAPHLQLGDLLEIDAQTENLYPATHQYNIVGINKSVGSSHGMSVTLRRRR